ncbi:MAG: cytochrome P460 family protein [Telmatospirillum sp.]|nr:cytochrome P460 family protein [Telmatospirillum sp.]
MPIALLALLLLTIALPARAQTFVDECRVARLAAKPAPREAQGRLGAPPALLTQAEIELTAACMAAALDRSFAAVGDAALRRVREWAPMSRSFKASEHGTFLRVYANPQAAESYARYEEGPRMPQGAIVIKRSFRVEPDGRARPHRIYVMEKMGAGYETGINDWRFAAYEPNGTLVGETGGRDNARVRFCAECHAAAREQDFLIFVLPKFRINSIGE